MSPLVRDAAEVLMVVAVGGMLWSAIGRVRHRKIRPLRCPACGRAVSRAYPFCPGCREPIG